MKKLLLIALLLSVKAYANEEVHSAPMMPCSQEESVCCATEMACRLADMMYNRSQMEQMARSVCHQTRGNNCSMKIGMDVDKMVNAMSAKFAANHRMNVAQVYMKHFTPAELRDMVAFHESEVGQKMLATMPTISMECTPMTMQMMQEVMNENMSSDSTESTNAN